MFCINAGTLNTYFCQIKENHFPNQNAILVHPFPQLDVFHAPLGCCRCK